MATHVEESEAMFALRPVTFRYDWKAPYTANRAKFVRAFYDYARTQIPADERSSGARAEVRCAVIAACVYIVRKSTAVAISDAKQPLATVPNHARALRRASSFSWMLSNPPLLKTATTSFDRSSGTIRSTIALAFSS